MAVFCAADVHWRPRAAPDAVDAFGSFLADLRDLAETDEDTTLFVLGDLFDFWWEHRGEHHPAYAPHVAELRRTARAGVRVVLLFGNRDFTLGNVLPERAGVEIGGDRIHVEIAGRRYIMEHGDQLCTADRRYQAYRRVIRSAPVRALMKLIPMSRIDGIVSRMQNVSRAEIARKQEVELAIPDAAVANRGLHGADTVICGHVHRPQRRRVNHDGRATDLVVLGPWNTEAGSYARITGTQVELRRYPQVSPGS